MEKVKATFSTEITFGQAISIAMTIITAVIINWVNINGRITVLEQQVEVLKLENTETRAFREKVLDKLEHIQLKMEMKQDRKDYNNSSLDTN